MNCEATLAIWLDQSLNHIHSFLRKDWISYLALFLARKAEDALHYAFVLVSRVVVVRKCRYTTHDFIGQQAKKVKINTLVIRSMH